MPVQRTSRRLRVPSAAAVTPRRLRISLRQRPPLLREGVSLICCCCCSPTGSGMASSSPIADAAARHRGRQPFRRRCLCSAKPPPSCGPPLSNSERCSPDTASNPHRSLRTTPHSPETTPIQPEPPRKNSDLTRTAPK